MRRRIPWDILLPAFKQEITSEQEELLNIWLEKDDNFQIYSDLHRLWLNIIRDNIEHQSDVEKQWEKLEKRINNQSSSHKIFMWKRISIVSAVASFLILCLGIFGFYINDEHSPKELVMHTYSSLNGKSKVLLPDGSVVWLNTQSSITYSGALNDAKRLVSLQGEAYFEVAKDKTRPFIVSCDDAEIEVFGTSFNVNSHENVKVSLLSGSVSVKSDSITKQIHPGEIAICGTSVDKIIVQNSDVTFDAIWARESINFERKSIRELSSYLSKWYGVTILLDPTIPDDQAYTFKITIEPLEEILRLMARTNPIEYSFDENNVLTIRRKIT
ncbi:FecR family protein [Massilibacteroides sp.]|uniref:FecR family protein n=1 Tax=Massilibacteroides sp. TaxID=2034766 RepID=UPI002634A0DE|nr:FecR family protein [Massilibacteroides sp.]MDD4515769.1 FecR family protein [Massilibacteroides sp.]